RAGGRSPPSACVTASRRAGSAMAAAAATASSRRRPPSRFAFSSHRSSSSAARSEEHTSELQSLTNLVCRLLLEKKKHVLSAHEGLRQSTYDCRLVDARQGPEPPGRATPAPHQ